MNIEFVPDAFDEYRRWIETDRRVALKVSDLIRDILRHPFTGIGKPEPLRFQYKGYWSRRIDQEHRLIYKVTKESVVIISCYSHYK